MHWILSAYFIQGLPYALVSIVVAILYKNIGLSNAHNTLLTSLFILPWVAKPLFAPLLEQLLTKRQLALLMQCGFIFVCLSIAGLLSWPYFVGVSAVLFSGLALCGACYDITTDGLYLLNLTKDEQTYFVGLRTLFYQAARLLMSGLAVSVVGWLLTSYSLATAWRFIFLGLGVLFLSGLAWHYVVFPEREASKAKKLEIKKGFGDVLHAFIVLPKLMWVVIFLFVYNAGEAQLIKIVPLYLLDQFSAGGLGLNVSSVGVIYGGLGVLAMMGGALASSFILRKRSLAKSITPITALPIMTNMLLLISCSFPHMPIWGLAAIIMLTQFAFGLSNTLYLTFILHLMNGRPLQMSLYAVGTAIMALSFAFCGAMSGVIQEMLGYQRFFLWVVACGLGILCYTRYVFSRHIR
jgi:PAT family beta-lactamase induction signal transducer AmpG